MLSICWLLCCWKTPGWFPRRGRGSGTSQEKRQAKHETLHGQVIWYDYPLHIISALLYNTGTRDGSPGVRRLAGAKTIANANRWDRLRSGADEITSGNRPWRDNTCKLEHRIRIVTKLRHVRMGIRPIYMQRWNRSRSGPVIPTCTVCVFTPCMLMWLKSGK